MKITDRVLQALGCDRNGERSWVLLTYGYRFIWEWSIDPLVNNGEKTWTFYTSEYDKDRDVGHSVDHLGECFGMLANDFFAAGQEDRSAALRELLGIAQEDA